MKTSTKKVLIIISLSIILVIFGVISYFSLPFEVFREVPEGRIEVDKENGVLSVSGDEVRILHLTDLHTNGKIEMPLMFSIMKSTIMKSEPDLIVITGDVFSSGCREKDVETLCEFLDEIDIPWAVVLGNHDDETPYSLEDLSKILENADGSLFKRGNLSDRYGNYYYYLQFADGKTQQLIFMDTRSRGFTEESVVFYENAAGQEVSGAFEGPGVSCNKLTPTWFWRDGDNTKAPTPAAWALKKMEGYFPMNINFMLNISPAPNGKMDENLIEEFIKIGQGVSYPAPLTNLPDGWLKR